ncbi:MAG: hypothetical protein ACRCV0_07415 [Brevinema sp.]
MEKIILPRHISQKTTTNNIVISSQVDIFRNINGLLFPDKMENYEKKLLAEEYKKILLNDNKCEIVVKDLSELSDIQKQNLSSEMLLSDDFIEKNSVLFHQKDGSWILLPNEISHFHLYSTDFGLTIKNIYKRLVPILELFEEQIDFAFHNDFGYLTSDIAHIGNGLSCKILLNLAGLELSGCITELIQICEESRFTLIPFTDCVHEKFFILINNTAFGISEHDQLAHTNLFVQKLTELELKTRKEILDKEEDIEFFVSQIQQILSKESICYHETLEFIAIVDMLNQVIYHIRDRNLWLEQIYRLTNSSNIFNNLDNLEEIDTCRLKLITQIFNSTISLINKKKSS